MCGSLKVLSTASQAEGPGYEPGQMKTWENVLRKSDQD